MVGGVRRRMLRQPSAGTARARAGSISNDLQGSTTALAAPPGTRALRAGFKLFANSRGN
jgi:hypothetical protein